MQSEKVVRQIHKFYPKGQVLTLKDYKTTTTIDPVVFQHFSIRIEKVVCEVEKQLPLRIAVYVKAKILSGFYTNQISDTLLHPIEAGNWLTRYGLGKMFEKLKYVNVCFLKVYWVGTLETIVVNLNQV
jgi:hypothetical protein